MAPRTRLKEEPRREADDGRPTVADLQGENEFAQLAKKHWLKTSKKNAKVKVKPDVLKTEIWDVLEKEDFAFKSLLVLENLQILEKLVFHVKHFDHLANQHYSYLWPGYTEDSSNFHVLLIALISNVRTREHLPTWGESYLDFGRGATLTILDIFTDNPAEFSTLFRRILSMTLDATLSATIRTHLLSFIISAFQSLDSGIVRKECAPLVSISIWHNISSESKREKKLDQSVQLRKAWRAAAKRYEAADDATKPRLRFERSWLLNLILDFFNQLYNEKSKQGMMHLVDINASYRLTL
jgi:intron-binding protein aquarius